MERQVALAAPTMATPAPGFSARVMERIERAERVRSRRRAVLGVALLIGAATAILMAALLALVPTIAGLLSDPDAWLAGVAGFAPLAEFMGNLLEAMAVSATTVIRVGGLQMLVYALAVCAMTLLWARVVLGSHQWSPRTLSVGESK